MRRAAGGSIALLGAAVALAGCARSISQSAPGASVTSGASRRDAHAEIQRLSDDIASHSVTLHLPAVASVAPGGTGPMSTAPVAPRTRAEDAACHPADSQTCTDSCNLGDSICTDAQKICDLANDLPGDAWAADKCTSASQSCSDAHARCCACQ